MTLNLNVPKTQANLMPRITVVGVGGAGGNAVNNMILAGLGGVEFLIANTDAQAIQQSMCERCIQLGRTITQGLGAGSRPDIGRAAAEEALDDILAALEGTNMVFITAGMGGGTGTGGAPVIARAARQAGILTVGVVTKPFHFEGVHRMRMAEAGITELTEHVDTLIVIPNQNLFRVANEKTTFADAFKMADDVLHSGVRGVTDLMVMPGLINLDFADIRAVMTEMGKAMMGTGHGEGESRSLTAAEAAISNPLLEDVSMRGARGVLVNVTGGPDMTLFEVDEAANRIREEVDPDANIIFGSTFDENLAGIMRVSVVATGIDTEAMAAPRPVALSLVTTHREPDAAAKTAESRPSGAVAKAAPAAAPVSAATKPSPAPRPAVPANGEPAVSAPVVAEAAPAPAAVPPSAEDAAPRRFAAAALDEGERGKRIPPMGIPPFDRTRAQSLFAKMTSGAARALQTAANGGEAKASGGRTGESPAAPERPERLNPAARPAARSEPSAPSPAAKPTPRVAAPSEPRVATQTRLSGLDPVEPRKSDSREDELLEIPAFLRRQAN